MTTIHRTSNWTFGFSLSLPPSQELLCEALVAYHSCEDSTRMRGRQDHGVCLQGLQMNMPPPLQHSPLRSGAVSAQLLTCSYFETKGHCLESSAHPWQMLPRCLLLEDTWGKRTGVEVGLKNLKLI